MPIKKKTAQPSHYGGRPQCNFHLEAVVKAMQKIKLSPYHIDITMSFLERKEMPVEGFQEQQTITITEEVMDDCVQCFYYWDQKA